MAGTERPISLPELPEISPAESYLQWLQSQAWRKPDLANREWWTPFPDQYWEQAQTESRTGRVLIVGCGSGQELLRADSSDQVFAFDISELAVKSAIETTNRIRFTLPFSRQPLHCFVADATHLPLKDDDPPFGQASFRTALMVGVATSLIGHNLDLGLKQIASNIAPGGHLVISDFVEAAEGNSFMQRFLSDRGRRYRRDLSAVCIAVRNYSLDFSKAVSRVMVIRPRGLPWREALNLSPEEVAEAIEEGDFERLAQHRTPEIFKQSLERAGFQIVNQKLIGVCPLVSRIAADWNGFVAQIPNSDEVLRSLSQGSLSFLESCQGLGGFPGSLEGVGFQITDQDGRIICPSSFEGQERILEVKNPEINIQILALKITT